MSELFLTPILALIGVVVLCFCSIVLALKVKGDKVITWRGFGVTFAVRPCRERPITSRVDSHLAE